jgi:opacity protein-like surface antigen
MMTVQWMEAARGAATGAGGREAPEPEPPPITLRENFGYAFTVSLSGGVVLPMGEFADRYGTGGMGATTFGITGRRFGARLLFGSTEPVALDATDADYSAKLGRAVHVMLAIVPVELQVVATLPSQTSRLAAVLQAGAGFHSVTVRIKDTDDRIDEDQRFGFSAGAGLRYGLTPPDRTHTIAAGVNGILHGSGSDRYATVELEVTLVW